MKTPDRKLSITKLAVIESLREEDGNTGERLAREVAAELEAAGRPIEVQVLRCRDANGFRQIMAHLADEVVRGEHHPILHIECHGDDVNGLELSDGSMISWPELAQLMMPINEATELGLIVSVAACFGIGAITGVHVINPAPCYALIGPTKGIWSNELFDALKAFYVDLMGRTSTAEAVRRISEVRLEHGGFMVLTVQAWFRAVVSQYIRDRTSTRERKAQALRLHLRAKADGWNPGMSFWKRHYLNTLPGLLRDYHSRFFMIDRFPSHGAHYSDSLKAIDDELKAMGIT